MEHLAGYAKKADELGSEMELDVRAMPINRAIFWLVAGLALLIVSFRIMVWGAVEIDHGFEVSDLIIGLTIVAVDTSLSELASSSIATRTILRAGLTAEDPQVRENADRARENLLRLGRFDYLDIE